MDTAKLNLYEDKRKREFIAVITDDEFEKECLEDMTLIDSTPVNGYFDTWPTNRLFIQEK